VARLKGAKRQKNQLELAFGERMTSEARSLSPEGTEAPMAKCRAESLAPEEQWNATAIASVRPFRAASLPVSGGSDSSGPARRSLRSYGPDHTQASGGDGTSSSGLCEKKRSDDRSDRDPCVGHVSEYSAKAWLSPAPDTGRLKFSLTIRLIVCTIRSLPRHTVFWCPLGNVRLAIA
jgi:hypothetical protein